jgi:hypothetical protein
MEFENNTVANIAQVRKKSLVRWQTTRIFQTEGNDEYKKLMKRLFGYNATEW